MNTAKTVTAYRISRNLIARQHQLVKQLRCAIVTLVVNPMGALSIAVGIKYIIAPIIVRRIHPS